MYTQGVWKVISAVLLIITLFCGTSSGQYPSVPCPDAFEYSTAGNRHIGIINARGVTYGETKVVIELSQPGNLNSDYSGRLSLNFDKDRVFDYIGSGSPITYKVDFPLRDVIPQVSSIWINDVQVCSGPKVRPPSTTLTLEHTLTAPQPSSSFATQRRPVITPQNSNFNDINIPEPLRPNLEDIFKLSNDQRRPELPYNTQNSYFPVYNVPTQDNFRNRDPFEFAPTRTTRAPTIYRTQRPFSTFPTAAANRDFPTIPEPSQASLSYIQSVCGKENDDFAVRRLSGGGDIIPRARFPWIAAIFKKIKASLSFQCGGSLISTRTVISAAHCFYTDFSPIKDEDILISLGRHNLSDWSESYIVHCDVEQVIKHPDYRPELPNIDADLAVVRLKQSVTFSNAIRPVCMWLGTSDVQFVVGLSGTVVGWGRNAANDKTTSPRLVTASIVSEITCIRSNNQLVYLTSNRTLCAGNRDGSGPCQGDSGSGLIIQRGTRWQLRGTVSAALGNAINQCNLDEYVVYTDIAKFSQWIESNMLL